MKHIEWDEDKNRQLQIERDISFESIVIAVEEGKLIDIVANPSSKYPHQKAWIVEMNEYLIFIPFVEDDEKIFLKTAFKSRKATRNYSRRSNNDKTK